MFDDLMYAFQSIYDAIEAHNVQALLRQQIFYKRVAVPVMLDLDAINIQQNPLTELGYRFEELKLEDIYAGKWIFPVSSRRYGALRKIKKGLRGFGLINDSVIVGDIWCVTPRNRITPIKNRDLDMLKIRCRERDVYTFDMFICPDYREKKLAVPFHRSLESFLKQEGWQRIYAYYWNDNIAAKWVHWMFKVQELPSLQISRCLFLLKTH
jgi:hypothetical protein